MKNTFISSFNSSSRFGVGMGSTLIILGLCLALTPVFAASNNASARRVSARKGVWYFYPRATDGSGYYGDDNDGAGKRIRYGGKTYKMRLMNTPGDRAELTFACD